MACLIPAEPGVLYEFSRQLARSRWPHSRDVSLATPAADLMWALYLGGFAALGLAFASSYVWFPSRRLEREHRGIAEALLASAHAEDGEADG